MDRVRTLIYHFGEFRLQDKDMVIKQFYGIRLTNSILITIIVKQDEVCPICQNIENWFTVNRQVWLHDSR